MPDLNYDTSHTVTFVFPDGREESEYVRDGDTVSVEDIPFENINGLKIKYKHNHIQYEEILPVYEDITLVAEE